MRLRVVHFAPHSPHRPMNQIESPIPVFHHDLPLIGVFVRFRPHHCEKADIWFVNLFAK
jgi:hypothetical protein